MNVREEIINVLNFWSINEPALYMVVVSTHRLVENNTMRCPMRVGMGLLEYNSMILENWHRLDLQAFMTAEAIRILFMHPYERQPEDCVPMAKSWGSDCVLDDNFPKKEVNGRGVTVGELLNRLELKSIRDFGLEENQCFEYYARIINGMIKEKECSAGESSSEGSGEQEGADAGESSSEGSGGQEGAGAGESSSAGNGGQEGDDASNFMENGDQYTDHAANWKEDPLSTAAINSAILEIESSGSHWGSIPGDMVEKIKANANAKVDYRKVLAGFRASILSQKRDLTRMRPNRRSGFEAMGSKYRFTTRLAVGVDVSGSISGEDLSNFLGIIGRFFGYGVEQIDVVQFDADIHPFVVNGKEHTCLSLKKAVREVSATGRGGTDFQPFIDFLANARDDRNVKVKYDGAVIFTDGFADEPTIPANLNTKICWVLDSKISYDNNRKWMEKFGKVCYLKNKKNCS